jgi:hypothetical protein
VELGEIDAGVVVLLRIRRTRSIRGAGRCGRVASSVRYVLIHASRVRSGITETFSRVGRRRDVASVRAVFGVRSVATPFTPAAQRERKNAHHGPRRPRRLRQHKQDTPEP